MSILTVTEFLIVIGLILRIFSKYLRWFSKLNQSVEHPQCCSSLCHLGKKQLNNTISIKWQLTAFKSVAVSFLKMGGIHCVL